MTWVKPSLGNYFAAREKVNTFHAMSVVVAK
jgi:hypothetical protein